MKVCSLFRRKRVCQLLDTIPQEPGAQLVDCAMDLDSRHKFLPDPAAKTKQNSMCWALGV
ncbi:hypothetical protein IHE44_0001372 [Lamprotornis superbus]|uniref:Uncharacterized protein n=1 Tax=Lamprotornis superbus TaxID=245042 RepID=A0A835NP57_9PASS|nr:hypothetical protein IHE44_0001372 [Lamprotornis superbus]